MSEPITSVRQAKPLTSPRKVTPLTAIRLKCLDCSAGSRAQVANCPIPDCPLYQYRFGRNPARQGIGDSRRFLQTNPHSKPSSQA